MESANEPFMKYSMMIIVDIVCAQSGQTICFRNELIFLADDKNKRNRRKKGKNTVSGMMKIGFRSFAV